MNQEAKEQLNKILEKAPETLSLEERAFLRSRSTYLTRSQREDYASVLKVKDKVVVDHTPVESALDDVPMNPAPTALERYHALQAQAKSLGMKKTNVSASELEAFIASHQE